MYNFNVSPYFDDFDAEKNFHKILFRPGYPVQSRELTQLQTILQEQIKRFGDHIFKNGSMVIPGKAAFDRTVRAVKITPSNPLFDPAILKNTSVVGSTSGVTGIVAIATKEAGVITIFVRFTGNSPSDPTVSEFTASEGIEYVTDGGNILVGQTLTADYISNATVAQVGNGIFYINGYFVAVYDQVVVVSATSSTPSSTVALTVSEDIATEGDDVSLLDPAQGSSNENAPGAHRQKINLVLSSFAPEDTLPEEHIVLFKLLNGEATQLIDSSQYSELMKTIARRTYNESGNYSVIPHELKVKQPVDTSKLEFQLRKGLSLVGGYEVDNTRTLLHSTVDKARTSSTLQNTLNRVALGNYIVVSDVFKLPNIWSWIEFRDETIVTPGTPVGNIVGFAKVRGIEKLSIGGTNLYKVYIFDSEFATGKTLDNAASIVAVNAASGTTKTSANILSAYTVSNITGTFNTTNEISSQTDATKVVIPVAFDSVARQIFAKKKNGAFGFIAVGSQIKQATTNATAGATSVTKLNDPSNTVSIIKLPKSATKTVSDFIYIVNRQISVSADGSGNANYTLPTGETFTNASISTAWNTTSGAIVTTNITDGSNSFSMTGLGAGANIVVNAFVRKPASSQKSKTITQDTLTVTSPSTKKQISLGYADVFSVDSIMEGATDVTSRYVLKQNYLDGSMGSSYIELKTGMVAPTASITITFRYLLTSAGDFSTVDSYTSLAPDESFIASIPTYKSVSGETFELVNCIDFRPPSRARSFVVKGSVTSGNTTITLDSAYSTGLLTSGLTIYGTGVSVATTVSSITNGTQFVASEAPGTTTTSAIFIAGFDTTLYSSVSAGSSEAIAPNSDFVCDFSFYLPRVDTICINSLGEIEVFSGTPAEQPVGPYVIENEFRMKLFDVFVPAYTFSNKDVIISPYNRRRYTMKDIAGLDSRISGVEEMVALNLLEQQTLSEEIIDPVTGLNRFKSGFVVDNFKDHSVVDYSDATFATIDENVGSLSARKEITSMNMVMISGSSTGVVNKNGLVMLPYTEEVLINQPLASNKMNINPFAVFKWIGNVKLTPASDIWTETRRLADINIVTRT